MYRKMTNIEYSIHSNLHLYSLNRDVDSNIFSIIWPQNEHDVMNLFNFSLVQ